MVRVVGFRPLKGKSKNSGKEFDAILFQLVDDFQRQGQVGASVFEQFVSRQLAEQSIADAGLTMEKAIGKEVRIAYSRGGFVDAVSFV